MGDQNALHGCVIGTRVAQDLEDPSLRHALSGEFIPVILASPLLIVHGGIDDLADDFHPERRTVQILTGDEDLFESARHIGADDSIHEIIAEYSCTDRPFRIGLRGRYIFFYMDHVLFFFHLSLFLFS